MGWPIKDRAADMERGYSLNKRACENTRKTIESKKSNDNNDKASKKS
jgi:hypothetical protein